MSIPLSTSYSCGHTGPSCFNEGCDWFLPDELTVLDPTPIATSSPEPISACKSKSASPSQVDIDVDRFMLDETPVLKPEGSRWNKELDPDTSNWTSSSVPVATPHADPLDCVTLVFHDMKFTFYPLGNFVFNISAAPEVNMAKLHDQLRTNPKRLIKSNAGGSSFSSNRLRLVFPYPCHHCTARARFDTNYAAARDAASYNEQALNLELRIADAVLGKHVFRERVLRAELKELERCRGIVVAAEANADVEDKRVRNRRGSGRVVKVGRKSSIAHKEVARLSEFDPWLQDEQKKYPWQKDV